MQALRTRRRLKLPGGKEPGLPASMATAAGVALLVALCAGMGPSLFIDLTVAGVAAGGIAALSGLGIVLTFKATGVFNFSHGAMAMFVTFVFWQLRSQWGLPVLIAAPISLLVVGPGLGLLAERVVFRPLQARRATAAENIVATLGIFIFLVGVATAIWTGETRIPAQVFSDAPMSLFGGAVVMGVDQLGVVVTVLVVSSALWWLFSRTHLGVQIRAVVDRRDLAQLASINANRVSAIAWALGAGLAGLTGVLLAPTAFGLDTYRLTLLVIETFSVAVVAKLVSLPLAVLAGLGLGLASSYLTQFSFAYVGSWVGASPELSASLAALLDPIIPNISVFVLFVALLAYRTLDVGSVGETGSFVAKVSGGAARAKPLLRPLNLAILAAALLLPAVLDLAGYRAAHAMLALAIVFLSIVAVTGFSGHITLAQAGFAGFGALMTARIHNGTFFIVPELPVIPAMLIAGLLCIPLGFVAGFPALRRRGLFLALTTLALGLILERYLFQNLYFVGAPGATSLTRPMLLGLDLTSNLAFYFFELVILGLAIKLTVNLRSGRLGRILAAMRDSEEGAKAIGIPLRKYKLFIFSASAFMAGIGGSLLSQSVGTFDPFTFLTFNSLLWFAVVVVAGVGSVYGALLAAFLYTMLGELLGYGGLAILLIGLAALALGRMPGGLVGLAQRFTSTVWVPRGLTDAYVRHAYVRHAYVRHAYVRHDQAAASRQDPRPTPYAERVLAELRRGAQ